MLQSLKLTYLNTYVFHGLKNLNNGYDVASILYFSEEDFEVVLNRVEEQGLGIHGIEPWLDGEFFDVETSSTPFDPQWYRACFERFKALNLPLHYAASYEIPEELLGSMQQKQTSE